VAGPLSGIRVLEMANFVSGPYASMLLGDLGATVWKVEMIDGGDPFRKWGGRGGGARPQFAAYNRGKESIAVDITKPGGQEVFRRLAANTDVLIENFRPGALDRQGLGYEALRTENPGLIYCAISGLGRTGPFAKRPSYDSIGLALSGLWSRFVDLRQPRPPGPTVADQLTAMYATYAILGALVHRLRTGEGQRVDVSMLLANMAFMPESIANYLADGEIGDLDTRPARSQAYGLLAADDLPLAIHISSVPKFWEGLVRAIERPELAGDPRFATNTERVRNYAALRDLLEATFRTRPRSDWLSRLEAEDVPAAPIYTINEAIDSPEARELKPIAEYGTGERAVRLVRMPADFSGTAPEAGGPPPSLGEHTVQILVSVGYGAAQVDSLRDDGCVA
jgi:crotonobetainyl-CoA:carnitine CoA-transferase CaiB-like acyl-CoA transferase